MFDGDSDLPTSCLGQAEKPRVVVNNSDSHYNNVRRRRLRHKTKQRCLSFIIILLVIILIIVTIFYLKDNLKDNIEDPQQAEVCYTDECIQAAALILRKMNPDVNPCDDFYEYSCGGYIATHEVHPDYPQRSLVSEMEENLAVLLKRSMERQSGFKNTSGAIFKAKHLYKSCLNQESKENIMRHFKGLFTENGIGLWPFLENYANLSYNLEPAIAKLLVYQVQPIFMVLTSRIELENSTSLTFNIFEGLPELVEEVYFNKTNQQYQKVKSAYKELMESSLRILQPSKSFNLSKTLDHINSFEQAHVLLLQYTYSKANEINTTNVLEMTIANFSKTYPQLKWNKVLDAIEKTLDIQPLPRDQIIIKVWNHNYLYGLMKIIENAGPDVVLDYVMWRFFLKFMPYLTDDLYSLYKEYIEKVGLEQTNPFQLHMSSRRWKFCLDIVSNKLPIVMTASYTKTHFLFEQTSSQVKEMIPKFEEAFSKRVKGADWLSEDSKIKILEKVENTIWRLASPEIVKDEQQVNTLHSLLSINSSLLLENLMEIILYQSKENIEMAEDNYMRTSGSNPLVVNAFHATELNAIAIPMGVMSQPLLDQCRPSYLNYAGLGTLIGHEFMHGFNHMGITFDHEGSINGSLTNKDAQKFRKMLQCFVDQYTEYVYGGKQIDGNYTLGENVCDSEGLELSLQAYRSSKKDQQKDLTLPGLEMSIDQIFFLQHAQIWCEVLSHKGYRLYSKDSHSPGKYRVIGAVKNSKSFSEAYKCKKGANMNPKKKCTVWM